MESLNQPKTQEEEREIFIPAEEVFKLPEDVREGIANRTHPEYRIIRELTLDLLSVGETETRANLNAYARQVWHRPYTPWYTLPAHWRAIGIEVKLVRKKDGKRTREFYILKGLWIKPKVLNRLMEYNK